jgi:hypothetical protein
MFCSSISNRPRICLWVIVIEISTIFLPCYRVFKWRNLYQQTNHVVGLWESQKLRSRSPTDSSTLASYWVKDHSHCLTPKTSTRSLIEHPKLPLSQNPNNSKRKAISNLQALEHCLQLNPEPLQRFAALKHFSGENISFLTTVSEWRRNWKMRLQFSQTLTSEECAIHRLNFYNEAIRIYASYVSLEYAKFPINLPSKEFKQLVATFQTAAGSIYGRRESFDSVATFFSAWSSPMPEAKPHNIPSITVSSPGTNDAVSSRQDMVSDSFFRGDIPESFDACVFDAAEKAIKELVLFDTWPKFLRAGDTARVQDTRRDKTTSTLGRLFGKWKTVREV